jgi:predicted RNA methylase
VSDHQIRQDEDPQRWFDAHFDEAAGQVLEFLTPADGSLEGKVVGDVGSGDGIIDLSLTIKGRPMSTRSCGPHRRRALRVSSPRN